MTRLGLCLSPNDHRLGTPDTPAIRSTRAVDFVASLVRFRYGLPGCSPPCTDQTGTSSQGGGQSRTNIGAGRIMYRFREGAADQYMKGQGMTDTPIETEMHPLVAAALQRMSEVRFSDVWILAASRILGLEHAGDDAGSLRSLGCPDNRVNAVHGVIQDAASLHQIKDTLVVEDVDKGCRDCASGNGKRSGINV